MKGLIALSLVALLLGSAGTSLAAQDLGQPAPLGRNQEFSWGLGYHNYRSEWKGGEQDVKSGELRQNNYWIQVAYTFVEDWEFSVRFGLANLKIDTVFTQVTPPRDFEGEYGFNLTLGLKGLLWSRPNWGIGPVLQANFYSDYETEVEGTLRQDLGGEDATILARYQGWRDLNLGLAAQIDAGPVVLYGGGFGYWTTADGRMETTPEGGLAQRHKASVEEKNNLGGYLGVRIPMGRAWSFHAEGQYKSDISFSVALTQKLGGYFD